MPSPLHCGLPRRLPRNTGPTRSLRSPKAPPPHRPPEAWGGPALVLPLVFPSCCFFSFLFWNTFGLTEKFQVQCGPGGPRDALTDRAKLGSAHIGFSQFPGLEAPVEVSGDPTSGQAPSWFAGSTSSQSPHAETVPRPLSLEGRQSHRGAPPHGLSQKTPSRSPLPATDTLRDESFRAWMWPHDPFGARTGTFCLLGHLRVRCWLALTPGLQSPPAGPAEAPHNHRVWGILPPPVPCRFPGWSHALLTCCPSAVLPKDLTQDHRLP